MNKDACFYMKTDSVKEKLLPYNTALEMVNEIVERDTEGKKKRDEGIDGLLTWSEKDTNDAFLWLNGYVKALEDNALITDEQSQFLRKQILEGIL